MTEPSSSGAEAFRMLRGNLEFMDIDDKVRSILVTSCTQGEGKTTTLCNLAVTLARSGKRVIVLDCDLRRPRVHHYFGLKNANGVSTVVAGKCSITDAVQDVRVPVLEEADGSQPSSAVPPVKVLTAGPIPPNPGEIVTSRRLAGMIPELTVHADLVLIDAPPFLAVGDASSLARTAGGLVLVMKLGEITRPMLKEAADFLAPLPCHKLGIVLTNLERDGAARRYKYYSKTSAADTEAEAGAPVAEPEAPTVSSA
jgi:non-specific protein-tyrosine kinase